MESLARFHSHVGYIEVLDHKICQLLTIAQVNISWPQRDICSKLTSDHEIQWFYYFMQNILFHVF